MPSEPLRDVPIGQRVTVRHRLGDGRASDTVGRIIASDDVAVTLQTRRGDVRIPLEVVLVHRVVQPVPWRIRRFLSRAEVAVLDVGTVLRHLDATTPLLEDLGTARIPTYLIGAEAGREGDRLRSAADESRAQFLSTGASDQPTAATYAQAHVEVEKRLGRTVGVGLVHYTDDRAEGVQGAREFGWQARIFTPPH